MLLKNLRRGRENWKQTVKPLFADMVSQYNLIGLLVRDKKHSRMMRILGVLGCSDFLQQRWRMKSCYSSLSITMLVLKYVKGGWELGGRVLRGIGMELGGCIRRECSSLASRHRFLLPRHWCISSHHGSRCTQDSCPHVYACLAWFKRSDHHEGAVRCREMSNYMMYLLFVNPDMLWPDVIFSQPPMMN